MRGLAGVTETLDAPVHHDARSAVAGLVLGALLVASTPALGQDRAGLPLARLPGLEGIELQYDSVRIDGTVFHLEGYVDFHDTGRDVRLLADRLSIDTATYEFEAAGNVSFEQSEMLLNGTSMQGDLDDSTLVMEDVVGIAPGPFYIRADRIEQERPGKFKYKNGVVTPCNQTVAIWEFRSTSGTLEPGDHISMTLPRVRVKGLPIIGLPWIYWPLQESGRQTGFMLPGIGTSNLKGFMLSESFFWPVSRSVDVTATWERFSKAGNAFALEFRHALSESSGGFIRAYRLQGTTPSPEEAAAGARAFPAGWSVTASHLQALPGGFVLRAGANFLTSTEFARGIRDNIDRLTQRQSVISADITKSWASSTLSLVVDERKNFNSATSSTTGRRLPQVKYNLRSTEFLGAGVYVTGQASAARFQRLQTVEVAGVQDTLGGSYYRMDAFPEISVPITKIPWLTFSPFFRWRSTWYSHSETGAFRLQSESLFRNFYETGVSVVGPSLFKIFETPNSDYSPRYKHLIEPRLSYSRTRALDIDSTGNIPLFDEVDFGSPESQAVTASITHRFFGKRYPSPQAEERQVWEIASFTLSRRFSLDPLDEISEQLGVPRIRRPWSATTRITPSNAFYVQASSDFTPDFKVGSVNLQANVNTGPFQLGASWFRGVFDTLDPDNPSNVLVQATANTVRGNAGVNLFGNRLSLGSHVDLDLFRNELLAVGGSFQWNLQCCSIGVDVRRLNFQTRQETQFSFLLNLAQVGSLGFDNAQR